MYKAIIIDDEPWTILDIEQTFALKEMGFEIIGSFRSPSYNKFIASQNRL